MCFGQTRLGAAAAVRQLVVHGEFDADDVWQRTGGNPFLVSELVAGCDSDQIPSSVRALVGGRLAKLSPTGLALARGLVRC